MATAGGRRTVHNQGLAGRASTAPKRQAHPLASSEFVRSLHSTPAATAALVQRGGPAALLHLQRLAGNRATTLMVSRLFGAYSVTGKAHLRTSEAAGEGGGHVVKR